MANGVRFTDQETARIVEMFGAGQPIKKIHATCPGRTLSGIRSHLYELRKVGKVGRRHFAAAFKDAGQERVRMVAKMLLDKRPHAEIAMAMGVKPRSVNPFLHHHGHLVEKAMGEIKDRR